jgi:basic membrane protein A
MKAKNLYILFIFVILALLLAACTATTSEETSQTTPAPPAEEMPVEPAAEQPYFVYVSPNPLGVNEFLKMGQTGLEAAGAKYNAKVKVLESEDPVTREENVRAAVNDGADIVIVLGFEFSDIVPKVAAEAPDTSFLIVDQCIDNPPKNVYCALFREHEAAYLIGAEAGLLTKSNKVGAIGALDIPFLHRYTDAFVEGAKNVNPNVETSILWVGGDNPFSDPVRSKEQALALADQGFDNIFAATAGGNFGIFEAAKEKNVFSYGVDVNQCVNAPGFVVDNLLKKVDVALEKAVDAIMNKDPNQVQVYGLKEGGIGLAATTETDLESTQCVIADNPDVIEKIKELQTKIINGEITIEDPMFK